MVIFCVRACRALVDDLGVDLGSFGDLPGS
jgi:hypothetical protein